MAKKAEKKCLECGKPFIGRVDKKFCDYECRITYNNRKNSAYVSEVRVVNNVLKKNRQILKDLNPGGKTKVKAKKLRDKGFNFDFFTSQYTTREGSQYRYCYDQGYLAVDNDYYLLVVKSLG